MFNKGDMALQKHVPASNLAVNGKSLSFPLKMREKAALGNAEMNPDMEADVDVDHREIYFLIMHFLSDGPCQRTCGQFWNELLEYDLLPRRYHAWYSRRGMPSGDENDNGLSFPLSYNKVVERYAHIEKDHLIKLLKQLLLSRVHLPHGEATRNLPNAADVPTLLGTGSFSLLSYDENKGENEVYSQPVHMRWPHMQADQVRGLRLREIGGGFARHHRAPSTRAACYTIAKPSTMVQKIENVKRMRGHRNAVYCAVFDRSGRFVITGSDDRLVKIWSMETAYCLASCRGHEGDITDLAVTSNNAMVASSSNDCIIRTWRLPDGQPISVLRGHTLAVTAIAFSPRPSAVFQLLSSADDGTCRLWDARYSQFKPRIYLPKPSDYVAGKSVTVPSIAGEENHQIFCCAFNASGTVFVTGSSDNLARVYNACKSGTDDSEQPIHEMDVLSGHENDVNYVQFSGCAVTSRCSASDTFKEENFPKFKNSWFAHDNIVTCSRDGSAIIWIPRSRKSHGRAGRWTRAYHLKVPPPPMPPQPQRGGPRQRVPPTPRGVNMIVWSLDNRFVLAAIMDCRICVWNASDGSLVHCLTGHTDSTYVLDVHPFNPRIAMSAGYDGKTIIWDIWEGKPIRIYEIGRFKLVDGKFSPDGTSIILSDDVGQLYILSTGQGESQKDAMYDQFFLGDYRPLIRDTHGNVIDQETQIPPHRRNMQDLLCDSSMIPYPEPYQSLYQQRRLGTLGIEWRPSSVRFAVGPDFSSDQDQIFPLPDLDVIYDPLPDFMDVMEWEPEIEVISDDTDSEFNVTESFGGDGRHISSTSSGNSECDEEDSEAECSNRDNVRRSRRRKKKRETEIITSSGRRIKRRNLDACDGSSHRIDQYKKSRNGRKRSRKKSLKASRPRRAAARNALTLFSKIKGGTPDQGEYCSDGDSSESESVLEDSNFESEESDKFVLDERAKNLKGKEVIIDDSEDTHGFKEFPDNAWNKRRLILKFPVRDSNISSLPGNSIPMSGNVTDLAGSSSSVSVGPVEIDAKDSGQDRNNLLANGNLFGYDRLGWLAGYGNDTMKWGGVRARTSKRIKFSEPLLLNASRSSSFSDIQNETDVKPHVDSKSVIEQGGGSGMLQENTQLSHEHLGNPSGLINANKVELSDLDRSLACKGVEDEAHVTVDNGAMSSKSNYEGDDSTWFNSATKKTMSDLNGTSDIKSMCGEANERNGISFLEQRSGLEERKEENHHLKAGLDSGDCYGPQKTDEVKVNSGFGLSNSQDLHSQKNDKMYSAVYRRSRSFKTPRTSSDSNGCHIGENKLSANCQKQNGNPDKNGILVDCIDQSQSVKLTETAEDRVDCKRTSERLRTENSLLNKFDRRSREDWGSSMTVGLRSTRNRRVNFVRNAIPVERRKASQSQRKLSWLMLSVPDCSRYIPQQCDEVAYLRQGHEEYISCNSSFVRGPWKHLKGEIRAVEFCKVMELEYSIFPGSGETCCKMTLEFIDPNSSVFGNTFKLTLPEVSDFPDFLVERSRYETAMERKWTRRDKCQVWWKNEDDGDGSWWEGRIYEVKPKSLDFPDSPWEKYSIRYKSDPTEIHSHSPWELHDPDDTQWELPHLDDDTTNLLLSSLSKLLKSGNKAQDTYGVHKLQQVSVKSNFLNRFPVPLSLEVILSRLENNYYRSLEAVKHDIKVMLSNAETYFLKNTELSRKIGRLSDWFESKILSL